MRILLFDSGLGGLTVLRALHSSLPDAAYVYAADDAAFPYGDWAAEDLIWRIMSVMRQLVSAHAPQLVVIACNTASTLALPHLRAAFPIPFVGTVPAIKPAAERTRSGLISVLATPGTVARDYTRDLIASFADHCAVTLVGSKKLARLAEDFMRGRDIDESAIREEIAPCFIEGRNDARTDEIVLACTHYPLLLEHFKRLAPWSVDWVDPAPAIARRAAQLARENSASDAGPQPFQLTFTSGARPDSAFLERLRRLELIPPLKGGDARFF